MSNCWWSFLYLYNILHTLLCSDAQLVSPGNKSCGHAYLASHVTQIPFEMTAGMEIKQKWLGLAVAATSHISTLYHLFSYAHFWWVYWVCFFRMRFVVAYYILVACWCLIAAPVLITLRAIFILFSCYIINGHHLDINVIGLREF